MLLAAVVAGLVVRAAHELAGFALDARSVRKWREVVVLRPEEQDWSGRAVGIASRAAGAVVVAAGLPVEGVAAVPLLVAVPDIIECRIYAAYNASSHYPA